PKTQVILRVECNIHLQEFSAAVERRMIITAHLRKFRSLRDYQALIKRIIICNRRNHGGLPCQKAHDIRIVKVVLVPSCKKEDLVLLQRTTHGKAPLFLLPVRLDSGKRKRRTEIAVAKVVKSAAVHLVRSRLRRNIDYGTACASGFRSIGVR